MDRMNLLRDECFGCVHAVRCAPGEDWHDDLCTYEDQWHDCRAHPDHDDMPTPEEVRRYLDGEGNSCAAYIG